MEFMNVLMLSFPLDSIIDIFLLCQLYRSVLFENNTKVYLWGDKGTLGY